ncbi:chaperone protein dnaJ 49 [Andrographis paniculata]|uniref:chaperone protein dnaJ 49 n=1 Tax=Andrographis paniculata TaxID=175694 RepID=UPI0021E99186|nr:chaperone protein dnaJ 49 [Andrographis paniculata]
MDGNKDEALRCIRIAKEALAASNKEKALKFLGIARRLNQSLPLDELYAACNDLDESSTAGPSNDAEDVAAKVKEDKSSSINGGLPNGERNYTDEHVHLVRQIRMKKDYYSILGLEKNCSVEEIRKAYRKLSLKVHPDKNKAPGSEEAFKKVGKAFKCLSDDESRRQYDQTGLVDEFEHNQQYPVRRRRRRTGNDFFDDEFDPDEIFRAFFGERDMFRNGHVYRTRTHNHAAGGNQREELGGGPSVLLLLQLLPFLLIILLAYLPFSEPEYSLQRNYSYQYRKTTEKHGVEFFVKSQQFDESYPIGSPGRDEIENSVIKDYKHMLGRYCHMEMQRRHWNRHFPTPHCDKLQSLAA